MNALVYVDSFLCTKYSKFWSVLLEHFDECKPLISEEWISSFRARKQGRIMNTSSNIPTATAVVLNLTLIYCFMYYIWSITGRYVPRYFHFGSYGINFKVFCKNYFYILPTLIFVHSWIFFWRFICYVLWVCSDKKNITTKSRGLFEFFLLVHRFKLEMNLN